MGNWLRYFFGTPRRAVWTLAVAGLITVVLFPGLLRMAANRLIAELAPLLGPALAIVIVFSGLRMILFGGKKK